MGLLVVAAAFAACMDGSGTAGLAGAAGAPGTTCEKEPSFFVQSESSIIKAGAQATRISLASYCHGDEQVCPPTFEAAKSKLGGLGEQDDGPVVIAGCGVRSLYWHSSVYAVLGGQILTYDDATGALTGAADYGDTYNTIAGCKDGAFQAGEGPPLPDGTDPAVVGQHRKTCTGVTVTPLTAGATCEKEPWFFFQPGVAGPTPAPTARVSLETFCKGDQRRCPPSFDAAKAELARTMSTATVVAGCGQRAIETHLGGAFVGWVWIWDDATGALVGAANATDTTFPLEGCGEVSRYQAGEGPPLPDGTDAASAGPHRKVCAGVTVGPL